MQETARLRQSVPAAAPGQQELFEPAWDSYGRRLALVFGNHAPAGMCPYYAASRCHHCDVGSGSGDQFDTDKNLRRLDWFMSHYSNEWSQLAHLVVYNSGSVLNPRELAPSFLDQVLAFARSLPSLQVVSLDSREAFVTRDSVDRVAELLREDQAAHIIVGIESADDYVRNDVLHKQMPEAAILKAFEDIGTVAARQGHHRLGVDVNVLIGGPGLPTAGAAVRDACQTARFAFELGHREGISVDLNLHPYYPSERGLARFPDHPRCTVSILARASMAIADLRKLLSPKSGLFLGWHDEGHDTEPHRRAEEHRRFREVVDQFNQTQNAQVLLGTASMQPAFSLSRRSGQGHEAATTNRPKLPPD